MSHEVKIVKEDTKQVVGTVNVNVGSWMETVFRY